MSSQNAYLDLSQQKLEVISEDVFKMCNLRMLYLEGNLLKTLPDGFFRSLNRIVWLDLRNNSLEEIPRNIAYHPCLETLLLQNNCLRRLPDELGTVPNLRRLHFSGNPLIYPTINVLENGTKFILEYLKANFAKVSNEESIDEENCVEEDNTTERQPKVNQDIVSLSAASENSTFRNYKTNISVNRLESKRSNDIIICGLTKRPNRLTLKCPKLNPYKTFHNTSKHINSNKKINKEKMDLKVETRELKDMWVKHLKELMNQQNAILQKEKNLHALKNWRQNEKANAECKYVVADDNHKLEYPYGIDPEYMSILAHLNVEKDVKRLLKRTNKKPTKKVDMMRIISDIVKELKSLETAPNVERSPRSEVEMANKEIIKILEIQRKIDGLKMKNDVM